MITIKLDRRNWLQFPDGTSEEVINKRVTEWVKRRERSKRRELIEAGNYLKRTSHPLNYSDEYSRLTILNQYSIIT